MQLAAVLERWRETRDPKLSDLVIELGGAPDPALLAPYEKLTQSAMIQKLIEALRSGTTPSLIALADRVVRTARGSWPVVELIAELPADPRLARMALGLLRDFTSFPHTSAKLWRRLLDVVERHGDPTCIPPLRALQPFDATPASRSRIANIAKRLAKHRALDQAELDELDTLIVEPRSQNAAALLAAVYAEPSADAPREVYADLLMSAGDPRGEFIQLQLLRAAGRSTPQTEKRELGLLKKHGKAWLGPLLGVLVTGEASRGVELLPTELALPLNGYGPITFSRGFVRRVGSLHLPKHREAVLDDPMMATIEHVRSVPRISKTMTSLKTVERGRLELLATGRTYDTFGISLVYATYDQPTVQAFAGLHARRLELEIAWNQAPMVIDVIQTAAHANPMLEEVAVDNVSSTAFEELWALRARPLPNIRRVEIALASNGFDWFPRTDHLDITAYEGDRERWRWVLRPFVTRPLASLRVTNPDSTAGRAALAVVQELGIATDDHGRTTW